jgi:ankyrin repeat protein
MNGETPMYIAAARGHEAIVQLLRHGGANLDAFASPAMRSKVIVSMYMRNA